MEVHHMESEGSTSLPEHSLLDAAVGSAQTILEQTMTAASSIAAVVQGGQDEHMELNSQMQQLAETDKADDIDDEDEYGEEEGDEDDEESERCDFLAELPSASASASKFLNSEAKLSFELCSINSALLEASRLAEEGFREALLRVLSSIFELPSDSLVVTLSIGSAAVQVDVCISHAEESAAADWLSKYRSAISSGMLEQALSDELGSFTFVTLTSVSDFKEHCGFTLFADPEFFTGYLDIKDSSKTIMELVGDAHNHRSVAIKGHFRNYLQNCLAAGRDFDAAARLTFTEDGLLQMSSASPYAHVKWDPLYRPMTTGVVRITSTTLQAASRPAREQPCTKSMSPFNSTLEPGKDKLSHNASMLQKDRDILNKYLSASRYNDECDDGAMETQPAKLPSAGATALKRPKELQLGDFRIPLMRTSGALKVTSSTGQPLHVVFVADTSGSMSAKDVACRVDFQTPLPRNLCRMVADLAGEEKITRLQAVRAVISEFINLQQQGDEAQGDVYSLVEFDLVHKVLFSSYTAREAKGALERLPLDVGSSTQYAEGLMGVLKTISGTSLGTQVRIVFLSDGDPCDTDVMLKLFQAEFGPCAKCPRDVQVHTIGFGSGSQFAVLQQMAALGRGSFQLADYDFNELLKTFTGVSTTITQTRSEMFDSGKSCLSNVSFERPHMFVFSSYNGGFTELSCKARTCHFDGRSFSWSCDDTGTVLLRNLPWTLGGMHIVTAARLSKARNAQNMVAKVPKSFFQGGKCDSKDSAECYARNVAATSYFAQEFATRVGNTTLSVADCRVLDIQSNTKSWPSCFVMESFLWGVFVKFNGNNGYVLRTHGASDVAQALSHFSYHESGRQMLVVDVQGIYAEGSLTLSDPQLLSVDGSFGRGDLGPEGINRFFASHRCNDLCHMLGLPAKDEAYCVECTVPQVAEPKLQAETWEPVAESKGQVATWEPVAIPVEYADLSNEGEVADDAERKEEAVKASKRAWVSSQMVKGQDEEVSKRAGVSSQMETEQVEEVEKNPQSKHQSSKRTPERPAHADAEKKTREKEKHQQVLRIGSDDGNEDAMCPVCDGSGQLLSDDCPLCGTAQPASLQGARQAMGYENVTWPEARSLNEHDMELQSVGEEAHNCFPAEPESDTLAEQAHVKRDVKQVSQARTVEEEDSTSCSSDLQDGAASEHSQEPESPRSPVNFNPWRSGRASD